MEISRDQLGRLLLTAPFWGVSLALAVSFLRQRSQAWTARDKITIVLIALAIAAPGLGITLMIVTDDDFVWCHQVEPGDPRCKHVGG